MTISFMFEFPFRDWVIPIQKVLVLLDLSCEHGQEMGKNSNSYEQCIPFEFSDKKFPERTPNSVSYK